MLRAIPNYFRSVIDEGYKVVWPTREQAVKRSIMVIVSVAVATAIFAALDLGLTNVVKYIISR